MFKLKTICCSLGAAMGLAACAWNPAGEASWQVQPNVEVRHSGEGPQALYKLGRYHQARLDYDKAIDAYREALSINPAYADARNGLGVVYSAQKRYEEAIAEFRAAVALAPHLAYLRNNLGYAYLLNGSHEEALRELGEAVRLGPADASARRNLQLAQGSQPSAASPSKATSARSETLVAPAPLPGKSVAPAPQVARDALRMLNVAPNIYSLEVPVRPVPVRPLPALQPPAEPALHAYGEISNGNGVNGSRFAGAVQSSAEPARALRAYRLEISNGNGVNGLARRVSTHFKGAGLPRIRLTNQRPFNQPASEIQYRQGYAAEAAALRFTLQERVPAVTGRRLSSNIDVRLVLGKDVRTDMALFIRGDAPVQIGLAH